MSLGFFSPLSRYGQCHTYTYHSLASPIKLRFCPAVSPICQGGVGNPSVYVCTVTWETTRPLPHALVGGIYWAAAGVVYFSLFFSFLQRTFQRNGRLKWNIFVPMSPSFLWVTRRTWEMMNTHAGSWPRWNRCVCVFICRSAYLRLLLNNPQCHPNPLSLHQISRSQSSLRRAETWPTASVPLATWSVPPRPRMACGTCSRWPPEQRCRSASARRGVAASYCEGTEFLGQSAPEGGLHTPSS